MLKQESTSEIQAKYPDQTIYALTLTENKQSGLKGSFEYSWNPLLPLFISIWRIQYGILRQMEIRMPRIILLTKFQEIT